MHKMFDGLWSSVKTNDVKQKAKRVTKYLEFYRENTADQIEWLENSDPEIKFKTENAIGSTLFDIHYGQLTQENSNNVFYEEVNQTLSKMFGENPVQVSNLTEGGESLAWLPKGESSPYLLEDDIEDYNCDIVIYRPKNGDFTERRKIRGIEEAEELGLIPQDEALNGLIKGLEDQ